MGAELIDMWGFLKSEFCPIPDVTTYSFKWVTDLDGDEHEFTGTEAERATLRADAATSYTAFAATMTTEAGTFWTNLRTSVWVDSTEYDEKEIFWLWVRDQLPDIP